jgi:hypothetical protein
MKILLSHDDLRERGINLSRWTLRRLEDKDAFPKRVPVGERRVAWRASEIEEWIKQLTMTTRVAKIKDFADGERTMLILDVWKKEEGTHFYLARKDHDGNFTHHAFTRDEFKHVGDWVDAHRSTDVYWCIGGFNGPHRLEKYAAPSQYIWADCDTVDPRKLREPPTIVWQSSPDHYHALWECDRPVSKGLRKGFNAHIGADKGGWGITKVLRVPGTTNYKYPQRPRVKVLRRDGPTYRVGDLMRYAVQVEDVVVNDVGRPRGDALKIINKYLDKTMLPGLNATLLSAGEPPHGGVRGKRSDVVHKLGCLLVEAGASRGEVAAAIFGSASFRSKWGCNLTRLWAEVDAAFKKAKR